MMIFLAMSVFGMGGIYAQSHASVKRVESRYSPDQLEDMRKNDPGKYNSMVWFMGQSWRVVENGLKRLPTEQEIEQVNIIQYDSQRQTEGNVTVFDEGSGLSLELMGADECFAALKSVLAEEEWALLHEQYLRNRALRESGQLPKQAP